LIRLDEIAFHPCHPHSLTLRSGSPDLNWFGCRNGSPNPKQNWVNRFHSGIVQVTKRIPFWNYPSHDHDFWNQKLLPLLGWNVSFFLVLDESNFLKFNSFFLTFQNLFFPIFLTYFQNFLFLSPRPITGILELFIKKLFNLSQFLKKIILFFNQSQCTDLQLFF
jgi:hypothetical protein